MVLRPALLPSVIHRPVMSGMLPTPLVSKPYSMVEALWSTPEPLSSATYRMGAGSTRLVVNSSTTHP